MKKHTSSVNDSSIRHQPISSVSVSTSPYSPLTNTHLHTLRTEYSRIPDRQAEPYTSTGLNHIVSLALLQTSTADLSHSDRLRDGMD